MLLLRRSALRGARQLSSSPSDSVIVSIGKAQSKTAAALRKIGWDDEDANLQAEIMTAAELCGNNQGLVKMYQPALMAPSPGASKPTVERETPTSAVVNANQSPGMLAAVMAADLAVAKVQASEGPIAIVGAYNTSTSSGQLAFYAERMAKKGFIGIALANSPEFVAAARGGKAVFGTNPIAFGIPQSGGPPLTFDMATSAIALFGVLTAKAKNAPLPDGVAYGRDGQVAFALALTHSLSPPRPHPLASPSLLCWRPHSVHNRCCRGPRGRRDRYLWWPQGRGPFTVCRAAPPHPRPHLHLFPHPHLRR